MEDFNEYLLEQLKDREFAMEYVKEFLCTQAKLQCYEEALRKIANPQATGPLSIDIAKQALDHELQNSRDMENDT